MKATFTILSFFLAGLCALAETAISKDSKALMPIVLPDSPTRCEEYAAKELAAHLQKICGAEFKTIKLSEAAEYPRAIYLGDSHKVRELAGIKPPELPADTTVIKTVSGNLVISGHPRRGTLYAVYSFLEDELGVRWWTPEEEFIPKNPSVAVGDIDKTYSPQLTFRQTNYNCGSPNWKFAAKMKSGIIHASNGALAKEIDDTFAIGYHSLFKILPPEKYFAEHPEWYSMIDGKRTGKDSQLCLTNREMTDAFAERVLQALRKNPTARFVHISQNDWLNPCDCPKCKEFKAAHGGERSATMVNFANKIGEAIEKEFPDTKVVTFAYQYTRHAPAAIAPRKNVRIELCSIECDFAHPLETDKDFGFTKDLTDWSKITKNLTIWNYTTCFSNYIIPYPNMFNIAPDIRFFVKNGAIGLFEQGDSFCNVGDFIRPRLWVMSKLMWNPTLDDRKLLDEFMRGYYSPEIAKIFSEYLELINARASGVKYAQGCDYTDTLTWMDVDTYNRAASLMAKALQTAKNLESKDPKKYAGLVRKVWREKIPMDFVGVKNYAGLHRLAEREGKKIDIPADPVAAAEDIINRFKNFRTERIVPYTKLEEFEKTWDVLRKCAQSQKDYIAASPRAFDPKDIAAEFKDGTFADFQEDRIEQGGVGWQDGGWSQIPCEYVADADASNGFAAKMFFGKRFEIQMRDALFKLKSESGNGDSNKFKVYMYVKNPGKDLPAGRYTWLNYNGVDRKRIQREPVPPIPHSEKFVRIELGTLEHPDIRAERKDAVGMQLLLYTGVNAQILVDRIVFVRQ